jgi:hypothetical protein
MNEAMLRQVLDMGPEEVIIGDSIATYEGMSEDTGEHILHMEDGEYHKLGTEELFNHLSPDTRAEGIDKLISHQFSKHSGKLYVKAQWDTGDTYLIEAEQLKLDEPAMLANLIREQPVEQTRTGYWNQWATTTLNSISRSIRRLQKIYEASGQPRRVLRRTNKHKNPTQYSKEPPIVLGVLVPRDPKEALELDRKNGDTKWKDTKP